MSASGEPLFARTPGRDTMRKSGTGELVSGPDSRTCEMPEQASPKSWRRRLRVSMRTMMVLVLILSRLSRWNLLIGHGNVRIAL
jgi:hypothetical protein